AGGDAAASRGPRTTAALALQLWAPGVAMRAMPFDRIQDAVKSGEAEAGLLIHEGQLTFAEEGLREIVDLGRWWKEETGLPLPLGGNVGGRDLGAQPVARLPRAPPRPL